MQIAGAVAEIASGKSWAELIDEIYVEPCDLRSLGYTNPWIPLGAISGSYPDWDGDLSLLPPTDNCLLYTSPSPRDGLLSRMPSSA